MLVITEFRQCNWKSCFKVLGFRVCRVIGFGVIGLGLQSFKAQALGL